MFAHRTGLTKLYFTGNAPSLGTDAFYSTPATIYDLPGTSGWTGTFGGHPAKLSAGMLKNDNQLGLQADRFGFTMSGVAGDSVVVEACEGVGKALWAPISTNTFNALGWAEFRDPNRADRPAKFYRFRQQ